MQALGNIDRLFAYRTKQEVNIRDSKLGLLANSMKLVILLALGYIFIIDKGYLEYEQGRGVTVTHVHGESLSASQTGDSKKTRYFSPAELTFPGLGSGDVMVATRMEISKQKRGVCVDESMPCSSLKDCTPGAGAECTKQGLCKEPSWCPLEAQMNYKLDTHGLNIWVKSAIEFSLLRSGRYYSVDMTKPILFPQPGFNTFTVDQLLALCEPPILYDDIAELGAAIEVRFVWDCDVHKKGCLPTVSARRIDTSIPFMPGKAGYQATYPSYNGTDFRELHTVKGIRFYVRTVGTGRTFSLLAVCLKLSVGYMMCTLAPSITDMIMLRCLSTESDRVFARKYDMTEDFDDQRASAFQSAHQKHAAEEDAELDFEEIKFRRRMLEDDY